MRPGLAKVASILSVLRFLTNTAEERAATPPPSEVDEPKTPIHHTLDDHRRAALDTPVTRNENSAQAFGFDEQDAKHRYQRLIDEAKEQVLGPMPIQQFLDEFLPMHDSIEERAGMLSALNAFRNVPESADHERDIYDPLVSLIVVNIYTIYIIACSNRFWR
ncbi:hypothetical protein A0H81_08676 [Grifola frondosa]|uniref:Uncharacterized protein n=1 Tax=Grifola frondosa TaxID=5627 RepID=A0A1C7M4Y4_GRIFR|nr:hypothetical protein A0H81_08676 [Grifola frondosa]